ncbi:HEAT repeat domain-containing protein [Providencia rettgeri]
MKKYIVNTLLDLTYRENDEVKIAAIVALGECDVDINDHALNRLVILSKDSNKEVAVSSINSLAKLSKTVKNLE